MKNESSVNLGLICVRLVSCFVSILAKISLDELINFLPKRQMLLLKGLHRVEKTALMYQLIKIGSLNGKENCTVHSGRHRETSKQ